MVIFTLPVRKQQAPNLWQFAANNPRNPKITAIELQLQNVQDQKIVISSRLENDNIS